MKGMATHPVLLPGELHGERSLVGYNPQGRKESDTTELNSIIILGFKHLTKPFLHEIS